MKRAIFSIASIFLASAMMAACGAEGDGPKTYPDPENPGVTICEGFIPSPYVITAYSGNGAEVLEDEDKTAVWNGVNGLINNTEEGEVIDLDIYEENLDAYKEQGVLFEFSYAGDYSVKDYGNRFDAIVFIFDGNSLIYGYRTKNSDGEYDEKIPSFYVIRGEEYSETVEKLKELVFG